MVSIKKSPNIPNKYQNHSLNITDCINGLQRRVLTKACVLKGIVDDVSIGPNSASSCLDGSPLEEEKEEEAAFQSNGDESDNRNGDEMDISFNGSSALNSHHEFNLNVLKSLSRDKKGSMEKRFPTRRRRSSYDKERERYISIAIKEKAALIREEEQRIEEELRLKRESLHSQRAQLDLERERILLEKEEECANETEYWRSINDQLCFKRLSESNERVKKALEKQSEAEKQHKKALKERRQRLDKILDHQIKYREIYQNLQDITKKCKNQKELLQAMANESGRLKTINVKFELLIDKCKSGTVSQSDVEEGDDILDQIRAISMLFDAKCEEINKRIEESEREKDDLRKVESVIQEAALANQHPTTSDGKHADKFDAVKEESTNSLDDCVDGESYLNHSKLILFLKDYEESLQPLVNDDSMKKFKFSCQKAVITPVNAISPLSREHMQDKYNRLSRLLRGESVPIGHAHFSPSSHPLGVKFCTNVMAKKFVSQGEQTVSSKPEAAFAIAGIAISLWQEFPAFGTLLMAHFQKECPYLIPAFMPQLEGQTDEQYYRILGYQYIDGKVESQDKFLRRMSGIMRLYAALLITHPQPRQVPHPLGLREGWRWLAAILNLEPRSDISATLILDMLDVAGSELIRCYGLQFQKLLHLLCTDIFPRIEKVTPEGCGGPVRRLKTFLESILKEGKIPPPEGLYPSQIW